MMRCVTPSRRWPRCTFPRLRFIGDGSFRWEKIPVGCLTSALRALINFTLRFF